MPKTVPQRLLAIAPEQTGCVHLAQESAEALDTLICKYSAALRYGRAIQSGKIRPRDATEEGGQALKKIKLEYPTCAVCSIDLRRPYICMDCAYIACFFRDPISDTGALPESAQGDGEEEGTSHIGLHLAEEAHSYACDFLHGTLFCSACDDVVYDPRFEYIYRREIGRSLVRQPNEAAMDALMENDAFASNGKRLASICRTPRGLRNMGATCFLNVILQSFLYNPLLRNYFLSDRHNAALCAIGKDCLACEMDKLFAEFFSQSDGKGPHGPTSFLYAIWMDSSSAELSQSGQHDAHEMFISALNGIHNALTQHAMDRGRLPHFPIDAPDANEQLYQRSDRSLGTREKQLDHGEGCPCVIHRTFCGVLQSSVTCLRCAKVTHTREPFLDLSLDVRANALGTVEESELKKRSAKKDDKKTRAVPPKTETQNLLSCLVRYCSPEHLAEASYRCSVCRHSSRAVKQLALLHLPPVLCIQLKRFEHSTAATKVDDHVQFPLQLDIRECCLVSQKETNGAPAKDPVAFVYDLFTVVVHEGTLSSGHYTNYSRWKQQWYRFDDDKVAPATIAQVLQARAYQLFYVRQSLHNQANHGIHV
ncbi:ubiquitinyl hydrolase 1 [Malassezia vespertilionis]|uniref:Uncharacterized protein n=1 Tax=Malassezia vespertilionis TaxID=2020962 RepID=A0A2N1J8T8_9BASI|nr:ubiquitinyl hydrolase 1 [Malassezia vespertilionis]PKI82969.1 hypothetical protein MVES_002813 [Malassezia vespertilionis]WFD07597.1 ubiquitinyl hydrolase 1 [Malassezia vespertilionis]